jgi:ribosome-associated toxin RatA of RatAB toxin-antitoxin module
MQSVKRSVLVAHSARQMFDLVDAIELYPEFLPWCGGAQVLETRADGKTARIDIDYAGIRAHFTTDNVNRPVNRSSSRCARAPSVTFPASGASFRLRLRDPK